MRILNTIPNFTEAAKKILSEIGEVQYVTPAQEDLHSLIAGFDAAIVGVGLKFDCGILRGATKLKVVATATTGLDHIDIVCAAERGIKILSLRDETSFLDSITGTAELAFALMLNLMRHVVPSFDAVKSYEWDRERWRGHSLSGNTLGVLGLGRLGRMMVNYGLAFRMRVLGCDPNVDAISAGAEPASFDRLVKESDVISVHVHLTPETENLFRGTVFEKMKPGAYLINTSRGKIVDEDDLLAALRSKKIAGYGADVLAGQLEFGERVFNYPLIEYAKEHNNCLIVPHIGGMTFESREATDVLMASKLAKFFKN